jgi:hypothetical protein
MSQTLSAADLSTVEQHVGHALAIIHRVLPRLDDPARASEVQAGFEKAITALKNACAVYGSPEAASAVATTTAGAVVAPEIAAVIAAAVSVVLGQPYRLLDVQKVSLPEVISHLNVWAFEGRTQIFTSHKVR